MFHKYMENSSLYICMKVSSSIAVHNNQPKWPIFTIQILNFWAIVYPGTKNKNIFTALRFFNLIIFKKFLGFIILNLLQSKRESSDVNFIKLLVHFWTQMHLSALSVVWVYVSELWSVLICSQKLTATPASHEGNKYSQPSPTSEFSQSMLARLCL